MHRHTDRGRSVFCRHGFQKGLSLLLIFIATGASLLTSVQAEEEAHPLTAVAVSQSGPSGSAAATVSTDKRYTEEPLVATPVHEAVDTRYCVNDYLGFRRTDLVSYLVAHADTYLGTPYGADASVAPVPGLTGQMQCEGFVWSVLSAVASENQNDIPLNNSVSVPANGGGWVDWAFYRGIQPIAFSSKEEMLASGLLQKGDIIWSFDAAGPYGLSANNHVGFFWGDTSDEDRFWHSGQQQEEVRYAGEAGCNRITPIESMSTSPSVWWVFPLSEDATYNPVLWMHLPQAASATNNATTAEPEEKELIFFD